MIGRSTLLAPWSGRGSSNASLLRSMLRARRRGNPIGNAFAQADTLAQLGVVYKAHCPPHTSRSDSPRRNLSEPRGVAPKGSPGKMNAGSASPSSPRSIYADTGVQVAPVYGTTANLSDRFSATGSRNLALAEIISPTGGPTFAACFVFVLLLPYCPPATPLLRRSLTSTLRFSARPDGDSLEPAGLVSPIAPGARMRPTGTPHS